MEIKVYTLISDTSVHWHKSAIENILMREIASNIFYIFIHGVWSEQRPYGEIAIYFVMKCLLNLLLLKTVEQVDAEVVYFADLFVLWLNRFIRIGHVSVEI